MMDKKLLCCVVALALILTFLYIPCVQNLTYTIDGIEDMNESYSYLVYYSSNVYCAKNGSSAIIDYIDVEASVVLQQAINSLFDGGKILFKGLLLLNNEVILKSKIYFQGVSRESAILRNNNVSIGRAMLSCGPEPATGITISDLTIDLNQKTGVFPLKLSNVTGINLERLKVYNGVYGDASSAVSLGNAEAPNSDVLVKDCIFDNLYNVGGEALNRVRFVGNIYTNSFSGGFLTPRSNIVWFTENYLEWDTNAIGIDIAQSNYARVTGNIINISGSTAAIYTEGADGEGYHITIANNIILRIGGSGIDLSALSGSTESHVAVTGNTIRNWGTYAIALSRCTDCVVSNNIISDGDNRAIVLDSSNRITVIGNTMRGWADGYEALLIYDSINIDVFMNRLDGITPSSRTGILEASTSNCNRLFDNRIMNVATQIVTVGSETRIR